MPVFTHNKLKGYYLNAVAIVVAPNRRIAADLLESKLERMGLKQQYPVQDGLSEFKPLADVVTDDVEAVEILFDGDY